MEFTFAPMTEPDARAVQAWRYEREYAVYNMEPDDPEGVAEMLDPRSPYYAARDECGSLVGFFAFGTSAGIQFPAPPALYDEDGAILVGLGLRPDLTGKGLGLAFVQAGLDFARQQFVPRPFGGERLASPGSATLAPVGRAPAVPPKGVLHGGRSRARAFRLFVMTFNERAIRVYERAGFERVKVVIQHSLEGERPFMEMRRAL